MLDLVLTVTGCIALGVGSLALLCWAFRRFVRRNTRS